ncbi:MAG: hypothetical protein H7Y11_02820, partial [Armatimonadetes bacterium]|nr:hypothetical protein [Anaerolineae bacterium]
MPTQSLTQTLPQTPQSPLPELEKTIIEMAVEMMLIDKEKRYPDLIYGNQEAKDSVRITMHYVMAMLAYGFLPHEPEMTRAAEWFDLPFPRKVNDYVDVSEMNRLMVLLRLRPDRESVQARL